MSALKNTSEPVLVIHEIIAALSGGGSAAALYETNVPTLVKVVSPVAIATAVKLVGWLNRRYVSPTYAAAHREAAKLGIDLPSESVAVADLARVIDGSIPTATVNVAPSAG